MDVEQIKRLFLAGNSRRSIARRLSVSPYKICLTLMTEGLILTPQGDRNCRNCGDLFSPTLIQKAHSSYLCYKCDSDVMHPYTIRKMGCTPEMYESLLEKQNGLCAICGVEGGHRSKYGNKIRLAVDHDHDTGNLRGLLCVRCNRALGLLRDDITIMTKAVAYLQASTQPKIPDQNK